MHKTSKIQMKNEITEDYNNLSQNEIYTGRANKFILNELTKKKINFIILILIIWQI